MRELIKHITGKSGLIILLLITLLSQTAFSQSNWFWIQPKPQGNRITSIEFADRNNGCAVGDVGTIVRTTNAGQTWFTVPSPRTVDLYGVDFAKGNPNILVAVGDSGRILRSSNGGNNWYIVNTFPGVIFQDFDFATSTDGYAVGLAGKIYKTTNAGQTWAQQFSPSAASFRSVNFYDANYGIIGGDRRVMITSNGGINWFSQNLNLVQFEQAVGVACVDSMLFYAATNYSDGGRVFRSMNGGNAWDTTYLRIPDQDGGLDIVRHLSFGSKQNGIVCCDLASLVRTTNGGNSWFRDSTFVQYYQRNGGGALFFSSCWTDSSNVYVAGGGGNTIKSTNSGANWSFSVGGYFDLHSVYFINPSTGWVVGEEGAIEKTTDGGSTWNIYPPMTREILREVVFPSPDTGYISGDSGVVLKTTNAGNNWFFLDSETTALLFDVFFLNNSTGYIAGGYTSGDSAGTAWIRKTSNGGDNWITLYYNPDGGWVYEIQFFDSNTGVVLFDIRIERTTDGGTTWVPIVGGNNGSGAAMHFPNSQTGYVVGNINQVFKTTDQGLNWTRYNTNYFGTTSSVHFVNSSTGYAVGFDGALLYTSNGGSNWTWANSVTTSYLRCVNFADSLTGFIVGNYGNILKTTTGGITNIIANASALSTMEFDLYQNYPNPFNSTTIIPFRLNSGSHVEMAVFDISGKKIGPVQSAYYGAGLNTIEFNALGNASGIYFCKLSVNGQFSKSIKIVLTK